MTTKLLQKIRKRINRFYLTYIGDTVDLCIFDSFFPHPISVFRYVEFDTYIKQFKTLAYTTGNALEHFGEKKDISYFIDLYPQKLKVKIFRSERKIKAKLAVSTFVYETYYFLPYIEKNKIPFIFTLYPGGGFSLNDEESDSKLRKIFDSPYFKKVIVTQKITKDYLLEKFSLPNDKIEFIYGVPTNWYLQKDNFRHNYDKKDAFNICFVAAKYSEKGRDKGYDIFIEVAKNLSRLSDQYKFHVVGGFSEQDIDISEIKNHINFYGYLKIDELRRFYLTQDIILSPNRINILTNGAFDGFPTASVIEAGLCGVVMLITDALNQNIFLKDNIDCVIINTNIDFITYKIIELKNNKKKLDRISESGQATLEQIFSHEYQIYPRIKLLSSFLNSKSKLISNQYE